MASPTTATPLSDVPAPLLDPAPEDLAAEPPSALEPAPEPEPELPEPEPTPALAKTDAAVPPVAYPVRPCELDPAAWETGAVVDDGGKHVAPLKHAPLVILPRALVHLEVGGFARVKLRTAADVAAFEAVEKWALEHAAARGEEWFGRDIPMDTLQAAFRTCLLEDGTLKVDASEAAAFDHREEPLELEQALEQAGTVEVILELQKIRFARACFGAQWSVLQIQTPPPARTPIAKKPLVDFLTV